MATKILIFGNGYTGSAIARAAAAAGLPVALVSRAPTNAAQGQALVAFADAAGAIAAATHIVATAPPSEAGDPVLAAYGPAISAAAGLRWVGYLSSTGVYGDRGGAWVDETTEAAPGSDRARRRVAAEDAWRAACCHVALDLFRTAGIYGPGRSVFDDFRVGRARRVSKPGHAFGRIHRDDIAGAVLAAMRQDRPPGARVLHLADDLPAESADVIAEAAALLGLAPPQARPYTEMVGGMSEMARGFWAENRRVASALTQASLGRRWTYPTYREGLRGILAQERADDAGEQGEVRGTR